LGKGTFVGEVFSDGVNANKMASDYLKTEIEIPANRQLTINMAQGGGWVMKIIKK
jgi:alpha-glucosidase